MYNKDEQVKSIEQYINNNKDLNKEEIEHLEIIRDNISKSQTEDELLKWNSLLVLFLTTKKLDKKIQESWKRDKLSSWFFIVLKLLILLATILFH
jgi:hypothetical protein